METTVVELRTRNRERQEHETRSKKRKTKKKGNHYILEVHNPVIGIIKSKRR